MGKLKFDIYNKAIVMEQQLNEQLENYDKLIIDGVNEKLEQLQKEYEELKINSNVIGIDTDMNEYLRNQQRLRELPTLISNTEIERLKVIENKQVFKNKLCKGIAEEMGVDYAAEFDENMHHLAGEYNKHLTKLIEIDKKMIELEEDYNAALFETLNTNGVYITINKASYINKVNGEHNVKLNLINAK